MGNYVIFADSFNSDFIGTSAPTRTVRFVPGVTRPKSGVAVDAGSEKLAMEVIDLDEPTAVESPQSPLPVLPAQRLEQLPALYDIDIGLLGGAQRLNDRCASCWTL